MSEIHDKAIAILQRTHDGDDLSPRHLKLTELAVNGRLNAAGMGAFNALYNSVVDGTYYDWLFGIEHLTQDHHGYVYYKGHQVEHYSPRVPKSDAEDLAARCRLLELIGLPLDTGNTVWRWEQIIAEEEATDCALCGKRIWLRDSYSPADDAICAECDTEVTGREHAPSIPCRKNDPARATAIRADR